MTRSPNGDEHMAHEAQRKWPVVRPSQPSFSAMSAQQRSASMDNIVRQVEALTAQQNAIVAKLDALSLAHTHVSEQLDGHITRFHAEDAGSSAVPTWAQRLLRALSR